MQTTEMLKNLWKYFNPKRRLQSKLLILLMIFTSIIEVIGIGAVIPFLGALTSPEKVFSHELFQPFAQIVNISEPGQVVFPLTMVFIAASILSGGARIFLLWSLTRLSWSIGADLSLNIYRRTLYQPYEVHVSRNSSSLITGISNKTNEAVTQAILPVMHILSSLMILVSVLTALIIIDPTVALLAFTIFGAVYVLIVLVIKKNLLKNSEIISKEQDKVVKALQEGLGGIRDILINGVQDTYCKIFRNSDLPLRLARSNNQIIRGTPRFLIETMGMILIAMIALFIIDRSGDVSSSIPLLGTIALGSQKVLPLLQQIYASWTSIQGSKGPVIDVINLLNQNIEDDLEQNTQTIKPFSFKDKIVLKDICYKYPSEKGEVLGDINLEIFKGQRVGFIGTTGSGKSTILDIVMGLLPPSNGGLYIDNILITSKNRQEWQSHIAHVPQDIFLSDATIYENIAFGILKEEINYNRVVKSAKMAMISDSIASWEAGYNTIVGEQGVRLSGGQKQRIGIARAFYKNADVFIFDEATSALDKKTEEQVMDSIQNISKEITILMIAHRLSTLSNCDLIVELEYGKISKISTYEEIFNYKK
jgi:ATP-binding cassette, subfamily B, bacterial PglK